MNTKINKYIETVIITKIPDYTTDKKNVGILLDEKVILNILRKNYTKVSVSTIKTEADLKHLVAKKPDLVFSNIKYFCFNDLTNEPQQNIWFTDFLDAHNISYIGSNKKALDKEYDKSRAKKIIQEANINTANFFTTVPSEHIADESIPIAFPLFIKPVTGGDSKGINSDSVVYDFKSFQAKVLDIYQNQQERSLVETYLSGNEYSVSILEDISKKSLIAMPIEIIPNKNKNGLRILDFDTKKNDTEKVIAVTDPKIHSQLSALAIDAFKALGGKSFGRIDIRMDNKAVPHFIEANLMPGLEKGYFYRACLLNQKMSHEQMILTITNNALVT